MRNSSTKEEKDMVGSILCKQLYQMRECKFLQNFINTCRSDGRTHARAWKLTKVAVKAIGGGGWEMLAPTPYVLMMDVSYGLKL